MTSQTKGYLGITKAKDLRKIVRTGLGMVLEREIVEKLIPELKRRNVTQEEVEWFKKHKRRLPRFGGEESDEAEEEEDSGDGQEEEDDEPEEEDEQIQAQVGHHDIMDQDDDFGTTAYTTPHILVDRTRTNAGTPDNTRDEIASASPPPLPQQIQVNTPTPLPTSSDPRLFQRWSIHERHSQMLFGVLDAVNYSAPGALGPVDLFNSVYAHSGQHPFAPASSAHNPYSTGPAQNSRDQVPAATNLMVDPNLRASTTSSRPDAHAQGQEETDPENPSHSSSSAQDQNPST